MITEKIQSQAERIREAADALTHRITSFQNYLSTISGRAATTISFSAKGTPYLLWSHQQGKNWQLSVCQKNKDHPNAFVEDGALALAWKPLTEASLKVKIAVCQGSVFPDLLQQMEKDKQTLLNELGQAVRHFDWFFYDLQKATGAILSDQKPYNVLRVRFVRKTHQRSTGRPCKQCGSRLRLGN